MSNISLSRPPCLGRWAGAFVFWLILTAITSSAALVTPPIIDWVSVPSTATVGQSVSVGVGAHAVLSDNSDGNDWNAGTAAAIARVMVDWQRPDGSTQRIYEWLPTWVSPATIWTSFTPSTPGTHYIHVQLMDGRPWYSNVQSYAITVPNPAPIITSPLHQIAVKDTGWTYQIAANGNPTNFGVTGLPPGAASISAGGLISLTPSSTGTWDATITASNSAGSDTKTLRIHVAALSPFTVTTSSGQVFANPFAVSPVVSFGESATIDITGSDPSATMTQVTFGGDFGISGTWGYYGGGASFAATASRNFSLTYQPSGRNSGAHWIAAFGYSSPGGIGQWWGRGFNLVVNRTTPAITWNPASTTSVITQSLGATRLNASASNPYSGAAQVQPDATASYRITAGPALVGQTITTSTVLNTAGTYMIEVAWAQTANFNAAAVTKTFTVDSGIVTNGSVTPGASSIGDWVSVYRDGTTVLPYAWTETTLWKPDGSIAATYIDYARQGLRQLQVDQAGTWYYQMRVVDNAYNFKDQWIPFYVNLPRHSLPYSTSFEQSEGYVINGNLYPQFGWMVQKGAADVSSEQAQDGSVGVKMIAGSQRAQVQKFFTGAQTDAFVDVQARPVAAAAPEDSMLMDNGPSRIAFTIANSSGVILAYNGNGAGSGTWTNVGTFAINGSSQSTNWLRFTAHHDYAAKKWHLIVNGTRVASDLGFVSNSATSLTDITWWGTTSAAGYFDKFAALTSNPFPASTNPAGISASGITDGGLTLSWPVPASPSSAIVEYDVQRAGGPTVRTTSTSLAVSGLYPETTYSFTIRARNQAGYWSGWSAPFSVTTLADQSPPSGPGGLASSELTPVSVRLSWLPSSDNVSVTGYRVTRVGGPTQDTSATTLVLSGLLPEQTYTFNVQAFDAHGNIVSVVSGAS